MYNIKYITKNNEDYADKLKVYFSCHPDDLAPYVDIIANDILRHSDCAVFYNDDIKGTYINLDYENLLLTANLVVIPVTENFLFKHNHSREFDLEFARKNFIPVLPVMMQQQMIMYFNSIVGDIQFLDRTCDDRTAINYDEKLRNYLDDVLINDKTLQQIQSAFDARIFLSYRKKNRASANKLMRLIHQNDFCRDIAIWYDEMLTAGEDFNQSIKKAIEDCDIFAIAVTPKMLEEGNYVLKEELPLAKALGKEIFAAKVQPTDAAAIAETFDDITVVDSYDEQQFADSLLQLVKKIGIRPQNTSPQHRFFIGLAYLYGIDVERNAQKAFELIKGAADDGFAAAKEKLANMYLSGDGVPRDLNQAVVWTDRLIDQLEEEHDENPTEAAAVSIVQLMCDVCETLDSLMRYEDILGRAEDIEYYCGQYNDKTDNSIFWRQMEFLSACYFGKACRALGQPDLSVQYYSKAATTAISLHDATGNDDHRRLIIDSAKALFDIYKYLSVFERAEEIVNYRHKMCLAMSRDVNSHKDKINLINSHRDMGEWYSLKGDKAVAQQHLSTAFALAQQLYEDYDSAENQLAFAEVCDSFGQFYSLKGDHKKAVEMHNKSVALFNDIVPKTDTPYMQMQRALSCYHLALSSLGLLNVMRANSALEKAISIMEKLYEDNPLAATREHLLQMYANLTLLNYSNSDYKNAYPGCRNAIEIFDSETKKGNRLLQNIYGFEVYYIAGQLQQINKNYAAASIYYNKALALTDYIVKKVEFFKTRKSFLQFSLQMVRIGKFLLFNGESQTVINQLDMLVHLNSLIEARQDEFDDKDLWYDAARLYCFCDEYQKALDCLEKILPYYNQELKREFSLTSVLMFITYFGWMCQLYTLLGRTGEAEKCKETAEKLYKLYKKDFAQKDWFYTEAGLDPAQYMYSQIEVIKKNFKEGKLL